ncbi:SGNH/GDSL hydrolase family protein [Rhizomonospora bruguierae]|uniref:SGNH/GDSL hydrolase family protein n=1 Tax=Rhizomonospora bruguierae TaxID=1581705 RepID=UPI001BCE22E8|nr:SGNH/GDSL hydrolase family protein [Micromonospora sp. NBRC 107566]
MPLRPLVRAVLALTLTAAGSLAAVLVTTAPAQAALADRYVALGDSYSSGVGAGSYDGSGCTRSSVAYGPLWAANHSSPSFAFAACSGATTDDVLAGQLSSITSATTLVTITIGGNDAGFVAVVGTCQLATDDACRAAVATSTAYASTILPGRLDRTYAAVKSRAPGARLVVLGYPRLFETGSAGCGLLGMSVAKRQALNTGADTLATVIRSRAAAAGATFVDVRSIFAGHGVCGSSPWINGITALTGAFHPNATGQRSGYLAALTAAVG